MINAEEIRENLEAFDKYLERFVDSGYTDVYEDLDVERESLMELTVTNVIPPKHASTWFYGFIFGLWLAREKRGH